MHLIVKSLCEIIVTKLLPKYVRWPGLQQQRVIADTLEEMYGFPRVVGCIDCTHIKMNEPFQYAQDFVTWKQVFTINLQAVCDHNLLFTDIFSRFPGGSHDTYMFHWSDLFIKDPVEITSLFSSMQFHIVGDGAYPLLSYLLHPVKNKKNMLQYLKRYNKGLSACR